MKSNKQKNLFGKLNDWFRNLILDDVDKEYDGPLPYHKNLAQRKILSNESKKDLMIKKSQSDKIITNNAYNPLLVLDYFRKYLKIIYSVFIC